MPKRPRHERQRDVVFNPLPEGQFSVILADPPWEYRNWSSSLNGASVSAYDVLRDEDIARLPVDSIAAENSVLCMWATFPKLQEGLDVMKAWGFRYVSALFDWTKTYREPVSLPFDRRTREALSALVPAEKWNEFIDPTTVERVIFVGSDAEPIEVPFDNRMLQFIPVDKWRAFATPTESVTIIPGNEYCGLGFYTRKNNEICLLGLRGRLPVKSRSVLSNILARRRKHSEKPDCQYERIMALWPGEKYLELFARKRYNDQWTVWGYEAPKEESTLEPDHST